MGRDNIKVNSKDRIKISSPENNRVFKIFIVLMLLISIISIVNLHIEWGKLISRFALLGGVFLKLLKFNFSNFNLILIGFAESVEITILATAYSILTGLVVGAIMAGNITPSRTLAVLFTSISSFVRAFCYEKRSHTHGGIKRIYRIFNSPVCALAQYLQFWDFFYIQVLSLQDPFQKVLKKFLKM